jgi:hypothetical protein
MTGLQMRHHGMDCDGVEHAGEQQGPPVVPRDLNVGKPNMPRAAWESQERNFWVGEMNMWLRMLGPRFT